MNKYILEEAMNIDKGNNMGDLCSYYLMKKNINNVMLIMNEDNSYNWEVSVEDVINSDISAEALIKLRSEGGWELSKDKTKLFKTLN